MLDQAILSIIFAESTITDLVAERVFSGYIEQNAELPAIAMQQISSFDNVVAHSGSAGLGKSRFQFTCIGRTALEAKNIADVLRTKFHGLHAEIDSVKIFRASAENLFELADYGNGKIAVLEVLFIHSF